MAFDLKKLSTGDMVTGASGVVLLIFSFFKWYGGGGSVEFFGEEIDTGFSLNGWEAPSSILSVIAILIGIVLAGWVIAKAAGVSLPTKLGTIPMTLVALGAGLLAFLFVLIKFVSNTDAMKIGIYVGIIATAGLAVGGYLNAKASGDLKSLGGGGGTSA